LEVLRETGIENFSLVAHDLGVTVARILAIRHPDRVRNLVMFNTEIHFHRPPWIPFYQKVGLLPRVSDLLRFLLKQEWFVKSPMGFKEAYTDSSMLDHPDNIRVYIEPLLKSKERAIGALSYLKGIDWKVVDGFRETHRKIKAKVLAIWGADDRTFPVNHALGMGSQFETDYRFEAIRDASLLPHEEKPNDVCDLMMGFLLNGANG
jgi:pimeloyl-ACP methyl ester carboxylesterase